MSFSLGDANDNIFVAKITTKSPIINNDTTQLLSVTHENSQTSTNLWARCCNNITMILVLLCMLITAQSMVVTGQLIITIPTVQKLFGYSSFQMSLIVCIYNIFFGVSSVATGYRQIKTKLLWIGVGGWIMSFGCFVAILPHILSLYDTNVNSPNSFTNNETYQMCTTIDKISPIAYFQDCIPSSLRYLVVFCSSYAFLGIGSGLLHTLTVVYLDEKLPADKSGIYIAIFNIFGAVGPVLGFGIGYIFLRMPIKLGSAVLDNTDMTPESEGWIGAWWPGYATFGLILAALSLLTNFVCCKSQIENYNKFTEKHISTTTTTTSAEKIDQLVVNNLLMESQVSSKSSVIESIQEYLYKFKVSLSNTALMCIIIGAMLEVIPLNGFVTFVAIIMQAQFRTNVNKISLVTGALSVISVSVGFGCGSIFNKYVKTLKKKLLGTILISAFTIFLYVVAFIGCKSRDISGVLVDENNVVIPKSTGACNSNCNCNYYLYEPICYKEITFYNPCTAGCLNKFSNTTNANYKSFSECQCFDNMTDEVNEGGCVDSSCKNIYVFLPILSFALALTIFLYIPLLSYNLTILPENLKSFGVGLQLIFLRIGYIVGPNLYGALIDKSCILWMPGECVGSRGSCAEYNNAKMRNYIGICSVCFKVASTLLYILAYFIHND